MLPKSIPKGRKPCDKCGGNGECGSGRLSTISLSTDTCYGLGFDFEPPPLPGWRDYCPKCDGSGVVTLGRVLNSDRRVEICNYCQGKGLAPEPVILKSGYKRCKQCRGAGRVALRKAANKYEWDDCVYCDGKGMMRTTRGVIKGIVQNVWRLLKWS